jgi:hypothetical protein
MKHRIAAPVIAALALAACTHAMASTAEATLSGLKVQLVDLDPTDGITPSIVFQDAQGGTFVAAESGTPAHFVTDLNPGGTVFGQGASVSAQGSASSFASLAGDVFGQGADVKVSASASAFGTYGAGTVQLGDGGMYVTFTLSPETRLVISGDAAASVMSTVNDPDADAWASVFLKLTDFTGVDNASQGGAEAEQFSTGGGRPFATTDARHVEIFFDNSSTSLADGIFFGSVDASTSDISTSAVPEAPAAALFTVAGLGFLAFGRRRALDKPSRC